MFTDSQFVGEMPTVSYLVKSGTNPKTAKSDAEGVYLTAIHYMSPGSARICAWATDECIRACLHTAGNPAYLAGKIKARKSRTAMFLADRAKYVSRLCKEISQHNRKAERLGVLSAVRLNGTSDLQWEVIAPEIFSEFPKTQFYDYTKGAHRLSTDWHNRRMPANYDLTLSFSGHNWDKCERALNDGGRVAAVFAIKPRQELPSSYKGFWVVDGDKTDLTFTRPAGSILGLRAKGKARTESGPFVIRDFE